MNLYFLSYKTIEGEYTAGNCKSLPSKTFIFMKLNSKDNKQKVRILKYKIRKKDELSTILMFL